MTEPLAQARALFEHFKSDVLPTARVLTDEIGTCSLAAPVPVEPLRYVIVVTAIGTADGVRVVVLAPKLPESVGCDALARVGGMLIQISNLVRQIRALAGGNASDSSRSQTAV